MLSKLKSLKFQSYKTEKRIISRKRSSKGFSFECRGIIQFHRTGDILLILNDW